MLSISVWKRNFKLEIQSFYRYYKDDEDWTGHKNDEYDVSDDNNYYDDNHNNDEDK